MMVLLICDNGWYFVHCTYHHLSSLANMNSSSLPLVVRLYLTFESWILFVTSPSCSSSWSLSDSMVLLMPAKAFLNSQNRTGSAEPMIFRMGNVHRLPSIVHKFASLSDIWMRPPLPAMQAIVAFCLEYLCLPIA
jgi:hypothetical protein